MSKGKRRESSRISNNIYSRLSDPNDDESRFKVKLGKSRKKLRKIQRKEAKRLKHQKKLEWIQRRKNANNITNSSNKNGSKAVNNDIKAQNNGLKSIYKSESTKGLKSEKKVNFEKEREMRPTPDDIEIEYLERQLLKNKANAQDKNDAGKKRGRRVDVLQELKSEFLRDGFDEDFLDFLSNITTIADEENILDNDKLYPENNTLVKLRVDTLDELEDEDDEGYEMEEDEEEDEVEDSDDKDEEEEELESEQEQEEEELESEKEEEEEEIFDPSNVIKKQIGMVNRLSEGNYTVILNQLCEMYSKIISKGSENQVINECFDNLCDVVITMIINEVNVVISLVATQSALICSLTNYFNSTIIKRFVCKLFKKLESNLELMLKSESKKKLTVDENKLVVRNIIIAICSIYYYEVIDIDVIFHLIKLLTRRHLNEDVLQLLLILLKYSGQSINKNSEILGYLNDLVEKYKKEHEDFSNRVKFIEEELKSNKKSKNLLEQFDHLKNMIKSKVNMDRVTFNLDSIMNYNNIPDDVNGVMEFETKIVEKKNSKKDELIKKATKIGLNKDIQKTIFISIMDAISPENALDNILKVKLKTQQYNEVINIVIYCYLVEKEFNYYYVKLLLILTSKLNLNICKKYKRHINNNIVLYFKNFESLTQNQFSLLSKLFYHMVLNKISQLRLLNFISVNHFKTSSFKTFINELFSSIVTTEADDALEEYLIQELLSIKTEKYFNDLASLWAKYIESYCRAKVEKSSSSDILFKSYQRVFKS